jgi:hypothetical protein
LAAVVLFYTGCVLIATYPVVLTFASRFPGSRGDPLQALWVMRWYKECLLHGRPPFHCPDVQFPVGAHLGNYSPLHHQALLYLPLSCFIANDVLCYNLIWLFNLVFTGFGTFVLVWHVLRDRASACFGGLLAMLSGPVLLHASGHLELITLGWFPLFLVVWMRWVDEPSRGRLLLAILLYLLVALSAAYFAVFAVVPAGLYVLWQAFRSGRRGVIPWLRRRLGPFCAFAAMAMSGLLLLFSSQLLSRAQGYSLPRPEMEFFSYRASPWSVAVPSSVHSLGRLLRVDFYHWSNASEVESCSFLGAVALLLLGYAVIARVSFEHRGYFWALFVVLLVLSFGAYWQIGPYYVHLPAEWLRSYFYLYRPIRTPTRINLFAAVCGALLAAAGLHHLRARMPSRAGRTAAFAAVCLVAVAELSLVPFPTAELPPVPACYAALRECKPRARFLEVPQFNSSSVEDLNSASAYWQYAHRGSTTGGYSGFANVYYDYTFFYPSPFAAPLLATPDYLKQPQSLRIDLVTDVRFTDYAWLYLTVHDLDYVVLHQDPSLLQSEFHLAGLEDQLQEALIFADEKTLVYDRARLPVPQRPTLLCKAGWRWRDDLGRVVTRAGDLVVFNPAPTEPMTFTFDALAFSRPRTVRLLSGDTELARWQVTPDELHLYSSPPFRLPRGLSELVLASDGDDPPTRFDMWALGDATPYSLRVASVGLKAAR